jgi:hypothetical protein
VQVNNKGMTVSIQIVTHKDVVRHTVGRVVIVVSLTVAVSWLMITLQLGTDPDATVRVGYVTVSVIIVGAIVAALLTSALAYHTACMGLCLSRRHHAISVVLCHSILLFDLRRKHSSVPTAYFHRRRAQRRSRTALLQRRRRLVLDRREHGGRLPAIGWLAAR